MCWDGATTRNYGFRQPAEIQDDLSNSSNSNSSISKFIKSPASGSSDLIYNNLRSNKTTYKSYNNIIMKRKLIQINN